MSISQAEVVSLTSESFDLQLQLKEQDKADKDVAKMGELQRAAEEER